MNVDGAWTLKYELTLDDLRCASAMLIAEDPFYPAMAARSQRRQWMRAAVRGIAVFATLLGVQGLLDRIGWLPISQMSMAVGLCLGLLLACLSAVVGVPTTTWLDRRQIEERLRRGALAAIERDAHEHVGGCELRADLQGVVFVTPDQTVSMPWTSVMKCVRNQQVTLLQVFSRSGLTVPARAFEDEARRERFHADVERWIDEQGCPESKHIMRLGEHAGLRCPKCSYELKHLERNVCPECGLEITLAMLSTPGRLDWLRQIGG